MNVETLTTSGRVRGRAEGGVITFKGVPYAEAPVGALRFKPPRRRAPWEGTLDAGSYGFVAPQLSFSAVLEELMGPTHPQGEDCLNLNVWTPDLGASNLPVMVWIHPGGFNTGSNSEALTDGSRLAANGVVVVSINYRVGAHGFLHIEPFFDDADASGNFGIADQIAALEWVQENAAAFGGDPRRVTIFGQSGGGMAVGTLLGTPSAKGTFRRAIAQSGAARNVISAPTAGRIAQLFLERAEVAPGDWDALQQLPIERILDVHRSIKEDVDSTHDVELFGEAAASGMMALHPVHGGSFLPAPPERAVAAGLAAGVDLLVGSVANELRLAFLDHGGMGISEDTVLPTLEAIVGPAGRSASEALETYRSNRPTATPMELTDAILTDAMFRVPALRLADAQSSHGDVYAYRFEWESPTFDGRLAAGHTVDIAFVFGTIDDGQAQRIVGSQAPHSLSSAMQGAWASFAATGRPAHDGLPTWPKHDPAIRPTMILDETCRIVDDPLGDEVGIWDGVI